MSTSTWPLNTVANASSFHISNVATQCNGCLRTYGAGNAIDNNSTTFWNDDTEDVYPDALTITLPSPVNLTGLSILSSEDGYITDYSVYVYVSSQWQMATRVSGIGTVSSVVSFQNAGSLADSNGAINNLSYIMINVTAAQDDYTRINEVYPIYAVSSSAAVSSTTTQPSSTTSPTSSSQATTSSASAATQQSTSSISAGAIAGAAIGGVIALALLILGIWLCRRKRNSATTNPSPPREPTTVESKKRPTPQEPRAELDGGYTSPRSKPGNVHDTVSELQ